MLGHRRQHDDHVDVVIVDHVVVPGHGADVAVEADGSLGGFGVDVAHDDAIDPTLGHQRLEERGVGAGHHVSATDDAERDGAHLASLERVRYRIRNVRGSPPLVNTRDDQIRPQQFNWLTLVSRTAYAS